MNLYVVRHARSVHNEWIIRKIFRPWLWMEKDPIMVDAELSEKGVNQAKTLETKVKAIEIDLVICSPLQRAIQTMQLCLGNRKIPIICTPLIREKCDRPADTGTPLKELQQKYPHFQYLHFDRELWWTTDKYLTDFKESNESVLARSDIFKKFLNQRPEKNILIVTHGNFIRTFLNQKIMKTNCHISYVPFEKL